MAALKSVTTKAWTSREQDGMIGAIVVEDADGKLKSYLLCVDHEENSLLYILKVMATQAHLIIYGKPPDLPAGWRIEEPKEAVKGGTDAT